jgi:hypothetical protein
MVHFNRLIFCCCFALVACLATAQSKSIYAPDSTLGNIGYIDCTGITETGISNAEIGYAGALTVYDSLLVTTHYVYLLLADLGGMPRQLQLFRDPLATSFGPRSYAVASDGMGHFYHALGSRGRQVVLCTDAAGQVRWAREGHHHELYAAVAVDTMVYLLGQDESVVGAHDFSMVRTDSAGRGYLGMLYGTTGEDMPEDLIAVGNHLVLAGRVYVNPEFQMVAIKADRHLDQIWGHAYLVPGKGLQCKAVAPALNAQGYLFAGKATGGDDSIFVTRLDTAGNPAWTRILGLTGAPVLDVASVATVVDGYILCGSYRGPVFDRAYVLKLDAAGQVVWSKTYGQQASNIQASLHKVLSVNGGTGFVAAGNRSVDVNFVFSHAIECIQAQADGGDLDCDSTLAFAGHALSLQIGASTSTQQFEADTAATFVAVPAGAYRQDYCGLAVAQAGPAPLQGSLQVVHPANAWIQLAVKVPQGAGKTRLALISPLGQVVHSSPLEVGQATLQWSAGHLAAGVYTVALQGEGFQPIFRRVVVVH